MINRFLRARLQMSVLAFSLLGAAQAMAEENPHLARGIHLIRQMDDEAALKALLRALRWRGNSPATVARIHLYRGIAYASLVHRQGARRSFTKALSIDSRIQLPRSVSPKIRASFEQLRRQIIQRRAAPPPPLRPADADSDDALFPTPTRRSHPRRDGRPGAEINWPAWVSTGLAASAIVAGVGLGVAVQSAKSDAESDALTYDEANAMLDRARDKALAANILFGVAGAAAGAAIYFFITKRRRRERRTASVSIIPGGAMVSLSGATW